MDARLSFLFLLTALVAPSLQKDTVKITVYYESYCPDSIGFMEKQLGPAWNKFKDAIELDLVPYGKASQVYNNSHWQFTCQHGEKECIGNILHACSIYKLVKSTHKHKYTKLVNLINCLMNSTDQYKAGPQCAEKNKIVFNKIKSCEDTEKGENLLSGYGNRTHDLKPKLTFVPTIVFNDVFSQDDTDKAMNDLPSVICKYVPKYKYCL